MHETIERYILELIRRSTPRRTAWNLEKIREGKDVSWNYIDGCMLTALNAMSEITGDNRYAAYVEQVADSFVRDAAIHTASRTPLILFRPSVDSQRFGLVLQPLRRRRLC